MRISPQFKKKKVCRAGWTDKQAVPPGFLTDNSCPSRINLAHPSRHPLNKYLSGTSVLTLPKASGHTEQHWQGPAPENWPSSARVRHWTSRPVFIPGLGEQESEHARRKTKVRSEDQSRPLDSPTAQECNPGQAHHSSLHLPIYEMGPWGQPFYGTTWGLEELSGEMPNTAIGLLASILLPKVQN